MITLLATGAILRGGVPVTEPGENSSGRQKTMAYQILNRHTCSPSTQQLKLRFDSLISHDITYVGIIQTARASGLDAFPVPYVLTNCHNSLCAVGGTINEDDHVFGLSAARRYGGIFVPANMAVIHQFAREMMASCGSMILGSDSHTRYGPLGTLGIGEGGPEIVKQLLEDTYDITPPKVTLVYLTGSPRQGVGPHDVAIALCGAVYKTGFVKNQILEFVGPGIKNLSMDYRFGIDVMTTETACLSSIWQTDDTVCAYLTAHGRPEAYQPLAPQEGAYYDQVIQIDLDTIEPMVALPFHPSESFTIRQLQENPGDILREVELRAHEQMGGKAELHLVDKLQNGKLVLDQGIIAGCAGGMFENIAEAAAILKNHSIGDGYFSLSIYPPSIPVNLRLVQYGQVETLLQSGALIKPCFCGPCFGAGEVPANNGLSIRHTTRNFPNREGSRPADGQLSAVMLMDARSIAATARNGGVLTAATEVAYTSSPSLAPAFDGTCYQHRCYFGFGKPDRQVSLRFGPNITEWPSFPALSQHLLVALASVIRDPVTTTDELIPSGETSSYRSNPIKLASFALSRRDPAYVGRTEAIQELEAQRAGGTPPASLLAAMDLLGLPHSTLETTHFGSAIFANKPGDGSAREQAASCQRVLGGCANFCYEYATKRYRSNCINWGMLPFTVEDPFPGQCGDFLFIPDVRQAVQTGVTQIPAKLIHDQEVQDITLYLTDLDSTQREILLDGCLMNWYAAGRK